MKTSIFLGNTRAEGMSRWSNQALRPPASSSNTLPIKNSLHKGVYPHGVELTSVVSYNKMWTQIGTEGAMSHIIGVRELKAHLSRYLKEVKSGRTVLVTEHGKPMGRIVPASQSLESRLQAMAQAGLIAWNGKKLVPMSPVARVHGKRTIASLLIDNRE